MNAYVWYLAGAFVAFGASLLLLPAVRRLGQKYGWVDLPSGDRKVHPQPVAHTGGLAIVLGIGFGMAFLLAASGWMPVALPMPAWPLWLGATLLVAAGVYDDLHGLGFKRKFLIQLVAAYFVLAAGYRFDMSQVDLLAGDAFGQALVSIPLTLLWVVGVINAINLVDGLDGLAGGLVIVSLLSISAIAGVAGGVVTLALASVIIGATAGFLVHNFHPARVFMGDTGSLVLGYLVAVGGLEIAVHENAVLALAISALAVGLPVVDTVVSYLRRILKGKSPFQPDRDHIHHRMLRLVGHYRRAVLVLYAVSGLLGTAAFFLSRSGGRAAWVLLGFTLAFVVLLLRILDYFRIRPAVAQCRRELRDGGTPGPNGEDKAQHLGNPSATGRETMDSRKSDEVDAPDHRTAA